MRPQFAVSDDFVDPARKVVSAEMTDDAIEGENAE
jgi:hypothetical protein